MIYKLYDLIPWNPGSTPFEPNPDSTPLVPDPDSIVQELPDVSDEIITNSGDKIIFLIIIISMIILLSFATKKIKEIRSHSIE